MFQGNLTHCPFPKPSSKRTEQDSRSSLVPVLEALGPLRHLPRATGSVPSTQPVVGGRRAVWHRQQRNVLRLQATNLGRCQPMRITGTLPREGPAGSDPDNFR